MVQIETKVLRFFLGIFFESANIINKQARARSTNKLGWKKIQTRGNHLPHKHRLKQKPLKNHPNTQGTNQKSNEADGKLLLFHNKMESQLFFYQR